MVATLMPARYTTSGLLHLTSKDIYVTPQETMIERLRQLCQNDERIMAALLYGSFTIGEADGFSDIECVLFFDPTALNVVNKQAWVEQIAPTLLFFADDFGHYTALFDNLVRGEFHFDSAEDMGKVANWKGNAWFPSIESTLLIDRTDALSKVLRPLIGAPIERDTAQTVEHITNNFFNLMVFGMNTWQRGEYARSHEMLQLIHRSLLWMVRLVEGSTVHWPTPSKALEKDLSAQSYARFVSCTSALGRDDLQRAYRNSWIWGQELITYLQERHSMAITTNLFLLITAKFFE